jgi:ABC-type glycerol-3-phosphate transport system substrate-binding protein
MLRRPWVLLIASALVLASLAAGSASATAPVAHRAGEVKLTVWSQFGLASEGSGDIKKLLQTLDARFEAANPGITIDRKDFPYDGYDTRLQAAIAANAGPDIAFAYSDAAWRGALPLEELLPASLRAHVALLQASQPPATDGKVHFVPLGLYTGVWIYNRALFRKAGLDPARPPTTLAQFLSACDRLRSADIVPVQWGFKDTYSFMRLAAIAGTQYFKSTVPWFQSKVAWTHPGILRATDAVLQMNHHGCFGDRPETRDSALADPAFRGGKTAISYAILNVNVADLEKSIGKGNLGVFAQPVLPGSVIKHPTVDASALYGVQIMKWTKNADAAARYVRFLLGAEAQRAAWQAIHQVPINTGVHVADSSPVYRKILQYAKGSPLETGTWPPTGKETTTYARMTFALVTGRTSVRAFLAELQRARG